MPKYNISILTQQDAGQAVDLLTACFGMEYYSSMECAIESMFCIGHWRKPEYVIIKEGGEIVCVVGWLKESCYDYYTISDVATKHQFRNKGYARALIQHVFGRIIEHSDGADNVTIKLTCAKELREFYKQFGFEHIKDSPTMAITIGIPHSSSPHKPALPEFYLG